MSDKVKVVHHSKTIGYSGTDRTAQLMCKYLAMSDRYEPFLVYQENGDTSRLEHVRRFMDDDHIIPYHHVHQKKPSPPYLPKEDNLFEVLDAIGPAIFHFHRSGYQEWPGMRYLCPAAKMVETNIFGYPDPSKSVDMHIYISDHIRERAVAAGNPDGPILYNPVEMPVESTMEFARACRQQLLDRFNLPHHAVLMGRVGRADNFDPISLKAFSRIASQMPHVYYLVVNPCPRWSETVQKLGLQGRVLYLDPIMDDRELSMYYAGLDIYAHARHDGECCPCNIQEAMMHGLATVSHMSGMYNGQVEIIGNAGFVVPQNDDAAYADVLRELVGNANLANDFAWRARKRAMAKFEASCIVDILMRLYDYVLEQE